MVHFQSGRSVGTAGKPWPSLLPTTAEIAAYLTRPGVIVGTPGYMSPEQAEGRPVDVRTDVFSLGVVLYEMLTGKAPFSGSSVATLLFGIVYHEPEPASTLRPELSAHVVSVLGVMLRKDPKERFANGSELLKALSGVPVVARTTWMASKRLQTRLGLAAAVVLGVVLAGGWFWWDPRPADPAGSVAASPTANAGAATAYDSYLEGLDRLRRWDRTGNLDEATRLFRDATARDPSFALAFARLADANRIRYALTRDQAVLDEASRDAEEAVRLNAGLAPVQVALSGGSRP